MTLHYHGTPITPASVLETLAGRCFCVSYAAPAQVERVHRIGQSVMLDNGAFSFWKSGKATDWDGYYEWVEPYLHHPNTWAVIPDVIEGSVEDNDRLVWDWPFKGKGAPVWHMHEPIKRLKWLTLFNARVCLGSSAEYAVVGSPSWHRRMEEAMNALCPDGPAPVHLHMLRGMAMVDAGYPFASVDSTDVARNHNRPQNTALKLAARWDAKQASPYWVSRSQMELAA